MLPRRSRAYGVNRARRRAKHSGRYVRLAKISLAGGPGRGFLPCPHHRVLGFNPQRVVLFLLLWCCARCIRSSFAVPKSKRIHGFINQLFVIERSPGAGEKCLVIGRSLTSQPYLSLVCILQPSDSLQPKFVCCLLVYRSLRSFGF